MSLLDRYIFKSVFFTCAAAVGLFTFIVIVPNVAKDILPHVLAGTFPASLVIKLVFGTVNANRRHVIAGVLHLQSMEARWPGLQQELAQ